MTIINKAWQIFWSVVTTLFIIGCLWATYLLTAPGAHADPNPPIGCQTDPWGFLGSEYRVICDGPIFPDGSWNRIRVIGWDTRYVPGSCFGSSFVSCTGGYTRQAGTSDKEMYKVTPETRLQDEPDHIPPANTDVNNGPVFLN